MLARIARSVPVSGISSALSVENVASPLSTDRLMPAGLAMLRVPFGPLVLIDSAWMLSSTPFGRATGFLATRDISIPPLGHEAQDFTADALLARLRIGHDALRGGDDGDAEAAQDLGQLRLAAVLAQARTGEALKALDHRLAFVVLQRDFEFGLAGADRGHARVQDVTLVLEHLGDGHLDVGRRHLHRLLANSGRILDADQHVGDGISHAHD